MKTIQKITQQNPVSVNFSKGTKDVKRHKIFFASDGKLVVDREKGTIAGISAATVGEARGHGVVFDQKTLLTALECIGMRKIGAFSNHIYDGSVGDVIGYHAGFSIDPDGNHLRVGLFSFLPSYMEDEKEEYKRIMDMAEIMPEEFGVSLVGDCWFETIDGVDCVRFVSVDNLDFVKNPAANSALYGKAGDAMFLSVDNNGNGSMNLTKEELEALFTGRALTIALKMLEADPSVTIEAINAAIDADKAENPDEYSEGNDDSDDTDDTGDENDDDTDDTDDDEEEDNKKKSKIKAGKKKTPQRKTFNKDAGLDPTRLQRKDSSVIVVPSKFSQYIHTGFGKNEMTKAEVAGARTRFFMKNKEAILGGFDFAAIMNSQGEVKANEVSAIIKNDTLSSVFLKVLEGYYTNFNRFYTDLSDETVNWNPRDQSEIDVWLKNKYPVVKNPTSLSGSAASISTPKITIPLTHYLVPVKSTFDQVNNNNYIRVENELEGEMEGMLDQVVEDILGAFVSTTDFPNRVVATPAEMTSGKAADILGMLTRKYVRLLLDRQYLGYFNKWDKNVINDFGFSEIDGTIGFPATVAGVAASKDALVIASRLINLESSVIDDYSVFGTVKDPVTGFSFYNMTKGDGNTWTAVTGISFMLGFGVGRGENAVVIDKPTP